MRGYPSAPSSLNSRGSGVSSSLARRVPAGGDQLGRRGMTRMARLRAAWTGRCRPSGALRQASSMCCSDWWCMPQRSRPAAGYSSEGTWGRLVTFVIGSCLARFGAGAIAAGSPRSIPAETVRAFAAPARTARAAKSATVAVRTGRSHGSVGRAE